MFYKVPSGLGIYFITSSLWAIGERLLLPKVVHSHDVRLRQSRSRPEGPEPRPRVIPRAGRGQPRSKNPSTTATAKNPGPVRPVLVRESWKKPEKTRPTASLAEGRDGENEREKGQGGERERDRPRPKPRDASKPAAHASWQPVPDRTQVIRSHSIPTIPLPLRPARRARLREASSGCRDPRRSRSRSPSFSPSVTHHAGRAHLVLA